jgi:DNA polymerase
VLGCGYGAGAARFSVYAASMGVEWSRCPVRPEHAVEAWRDRHESVAGRRTGDVFNGHVIREGGLWRTVEKAARFALTNGVVVSAGRCRWERCGADLVCVLPSGRRMIYRDAKIEPVASPWGMKDAITYAHRKHRTSTWGGKLVENITQAVCRDLLAHALVELEHAGMPVVLHVHDEIVREVESEDELHAMQRACESPPPWATGFPIKTTGYTSTRYRK